MTTLPSDQNPYELGTAEAAEAVLRDLYIDLRDKLFHWSKVTLQTPQPKMGYVGQHLVSVVTGYPGGRSGARGKDLILPGGSDAEIKTCYRVDQLGSCRACGSLVASVEVECAVCFSVDIQRKDDSKWLLGPRNESEMTSYFDAKFYFFVLFDFEDLQDPTVINVRIWRVDPKSRGFSYAMVDYYVNIGSKSRSGAPLNLWPFELKFQLMQPELIYHSQILSDNTVETIFFPSDRQAFVVPSFAPLTYFTRKLGFSIDMAHDVARAFGRDLCHLSSKAAMLSELERARRENDWSDDALVRVIAESMYDDRIAGHRELLPFE